MTEALIVYTCLVVVCVLSILVHLHIFFLYFNQPGFSDDVCSLIFQRKDFSSTSLNWGYGALPHGNSTVFDIRNAQKHTFSTSSRCCNNLNR